MTRELLSEVLDVYVYELDFIQDNRQFFKFTSIEGSDDYQVNNINIYELAHLCRIWAAKENFKIDDDILYGIERGRVRLIQYQEYDMYDVFGYKIGRDSKSDWFEEDSVPEAIFKACEWILEQKELEL